MNRRFLTRLAQEPLAALSAMAGAALLALILSASDDAVASSDPVGARQATGPAPADLRAGGAPRLDVLALRSPQGLTPDATECARAEIRADGTDAQGVSFVLPGA